jgi:hypothetical protein
MSNAIEAYPLTWPVGRPRVSRRRGAKFHRLVKLEGKSYKQKADITLYQAICQVRDELRLLRAIDVVISTNVKTRQDGLPYSGAREPDDPAAAVYFRMADSVHCLACDRWDRVADNLAAIAHHADAIRAMDRWGVGSLAQAFAGYRALPAMDAGRTWWAMLGFANPPEKLETVEAKWLTKITEAHPDRGGNANHAAELNAAMQEAKRYYQQ